MTTATRPREDGTSPRPIKRGAKVAEALAQEIVHEIVSRKLPPGTLLSSEAQMLEDYGVGRGSLREALRILEVHGLITMKPGRNGGPMVIEVRTRDYGRMSTLFFHLGGVTFRELHGGAPGDGADDGPARRRAPQPGTRSSSWPTRPTPGSRTTTPTSTPPATSTRASRPCRATRCST